MGAAEGSESLTGSSSTRIASLPRKSMTLTATRRSFPARNGSEIVPRSISKASGSTQPRARGERRSHGSAVPTRPGRTPG